MRSAFDARFMTRNHRNAIRQRCGYLQVGASRCLLLGAVIMTVPLMPMPFGCCKCRSCFPATSP
jgi:hypothetical protein